MPCRFAAALLLAAPAAAQTVPGLENFTLEQPRPSPTPTATPSASPTAPPSATPAPVATPTPRPSAPTAAPTPRPTISPTASASPTAVAVDPGATPSPVVPATVDMPVATPTIAAPTPGPTAAPIAPSAAAGVPWWVWALGVAGLAALTALLLKRRRRSYPREIAVMVVPDLPAPSEPAVPVSTPPSPRPAGGLITSSSKPVLEFALQPTQAGIDTLRVSLDYALTVANTGRGAAYEVAVEAWLISASREQDAELAQLFTSAPGAPLMTPFTLIASAQAELTGQAVASRDHIAVITAGERKSYVPVLAVRASYRHGRDGAGVANAAFLVGIPREGQTLLAPIALDRGARRHDRLEARRYGVG